MKTTTIDKEALYACLEEVKDPEVPVLSIIDLGIVRDIQLNNDELEVTITVSPLCTSISNCPSTVRMA